MARRRTALAIGRPPQSNCTEDPPKVQGDYARIGFVRIGTSDRSAPDPLITVANPLDDECL
jgi:hypothetical protein